MTTSKITPKATELLPTIDTNRARFWSKVDVSGGPNACWPWTASLQPSGYGQFSYQGKPWRASRALWVMYHGDIPSTQHVLHTCDNRPCVNPAHLYLGDHRRNMADLVERGRHAIHHGYVYKGRPPLTECKNGHPYDAANTYEVNGRRYCRACSKARVTAWKSAHRARRHVPDPGAIAQAKRLVGEGFSIRAAARQLNTTHTTIRRWIAMNGKVAR